MTINNQIMNTNELENWLYGAANILRGPINAADFKTYIFPLIFLKRICDVHDEEYRIVIEKYGEAFPENFRFTIPENCHWKEIRETTSNVGTAISNAMHCIEKANQDVLWSIFGDADWTNKELFKDELLSKLINHFSEYNLSVTNVHQDMAGQAYEYLIKKFADESNKSAGEYYTPRAIIQLLMRILKPLEGESVYDGCAGTGGFLLGACDYVYQNGGDIRKLKLYGQESNLTTQTIARMNLLFHGIEDYKIERGDTITKPLFFEGDELSKFDCVATNPPFSLDQWGREYFTNDPYHRNFAGTPPKGYGDYAFVQHHIASMNEQKGRMAIVLPQGALFRKGEEGKIRKKLLESDLLEAVIGFAPNLFYGTTLAACCMIFRMNKEKSHKNKVLFLDASNQYRIWKNQNELLPKHIDAISKWYESYSDIEGISKVVTLDDIIEEDYNLNISLYVEPVIEEDSMSLEEAYTQLIAADNERKEAENKLNLLLSKEGYI